MLKWFFKKKVILKNTSYFGVCKSFYALQANYFYPKADIFVNIHFQNPFSILAPFLNTFHHRPNKTQAKNEDLCLEISL